MDPRVKPEDDGREGRRRPGLSVQVGAGRRQALAAERRQPLALLEKLAE
ncbi:MAG: hypothetical protein RLO22_21805 [Sneathiellaceae bacterium]